MHKWRSKLSRDFLASASRTSPFETPAEVITVVPVNTEELEKLTTALEGLTGKRVRIKNKIDPAIIAGMVVRTADVVIDMSMASRLEKLAESIHDRMRQEI